ncbi:cytochrome P450 [Multifurca ochricompacta]|uniref:Cytochrome P450 n=1 Tax=Multifurca ochricompacta TaxID=376703 RepID=A0AAD4QNA6_9AGAM|nr:cytochrome P450 [Multifurca ochricompacta]
MTLLTLLIFLSLPPFLLFLSFNNNRKTRFSFPLPSGPKPWPLLGNITDLRSNELWLLVTNWSKRYGDIVYLHLFGQGLVFLNSPPAVIELMERRSAIYSDRAPLVMATDLCGAGHMVAFTRYGEQSRRQRRLMARGLAQPRIPQYHPLIITSTRPLLRALLASSGGDFIPAIRRYAGGLNLNVVYGLQPTRDDDPVLLKVEGATDLLANQITAGGGLWAVDVIPFLKNLPAWFPGASFQRKAAVWKEIIVDSVNFPFSLFKASMNAGTAPPSFCSTLLQESDPATAAFALEEFDIKWTANSMYAASMDTTITFIQHFFLAMIEHPEYLKRAQAELDGVLGAGPARFPTFEDRVHLPFLDALFSETLRWGVPVPLDPDRFNPDRYLEKVDDEIARRRDPRGFVFGFGRRRCPGIHLVESSIWLLLATVIATLDIEKPRDKCGKEIEPDVKFENSVFRTATRFFVVVRPRSDVALRLIEEET